jgi:hypothetical protein
MTTYDRFDKEACRTLRRSMQEALNQMDVDGLTIEVGNMSFTDNKITIKVTAETAGAQLERSDALFDAISRHGIASANADGYVLVDYHPQKRKYPFIMVGPEGARYKISVDRALDRFGRSVEAA